MAVFHLNAGAAFRAENLGLDLAGVFTVTTASFTQIYSDAGNVTRFLLDFTDPVTHAGLAQISTAPGFVLDHSTFSDTFDTPFYENSALHHYTGVTSDFQFHDSAQGAAEFIGTLTGTTYDIAVRDSYSRVRTETQEISHRNTVESFTGLFQGDDQVTLGAKDDYFCDPKGSLNLHLGGGDDLGVHLLGSANDLVQIWGDSGNDRLTVQGGHGVLYGGNGRDSIHGDPDAIYDIYGGAGGDQVYGRQITVHDGGGTGNDDYNADGSGLALITYETAIGGIVADLWTGFARSREVGNDTVVGFRQLRGGLGDDRLTGNPLGMLSEFGVTLSGYTGADTILGTSQGDRLFGEAGDDRVTGQTGDDFVSGGAGNDRLFGSNGDDTLSGGVGRDTMTGNAGADLFLFATVGDSGPLHSDRITDFAQGQDRIDLHRIDARAISTPNESFRFIDGAAFTAAGQVRAFQSGGDTVIEANVQGVNGAEMRLILTGLWVLEAGDFVL